MKHPLLVLALAPLSLWVIFVLPDTLASHPGFWDWRKALVFLSGILALWWMSAGIVLAARPTWLERRLGGLDKLYRWHRNIGIGAGIFVLTHWMLEWLPKKLAKFGWLPERIRGPKGPKDWWISLAKDVGEWAGYILLAMVVIALIRRIPYRWFRLVHKAFGAVFIAGVFHGLLLMPGNFWQQPLGWLTALLAAVGMIPAILSLANLIGQRRQYPARVESLHLHADQVLEVVCRPLNDWPGHAAGQFLFADFARRGEGAHPFTIASAWNPQQGTLTLAIKGLGNFTQKLPQLIEPGQPLTLEGPYGKFDFGLADPVDRDKASGPQVWIAGGIGITPFLAQMEARASQSSPQPEIDLFYCSRQPGCFPENLEARCLAAGVRLHHRLTSRDGHLTTSEVEARLTAGSSVWFCGPSEWGKALEKTLTAAGLPASAFHREAFEFR